MPSRRENKYWPKIDSTQAAVKAMHYAALAAAFSASLTAILSIVAMCLHHSVASFDGSGLLDSTLFGVIAWRIYKLSLPWAIAGLVVFAAEKIYMFSEAAKSGGSLSIVAILFLILYMNAVRAGIFLRERADYESAPIQGIEAAAPSWATSGPLNSSMDPTERAPVAQTTKQRLLEWAFPLRSVFSRLGLERYLWHRLATVLYLALLILALPFFWLVAYSLGSSSGGDDQPSAVSLTVLGIVIAVVLTAALSYLLQGVYRALLYVLYGAESKWPRFSPPGPDSDLLTG